MKVAGAIRRIAAALAVTAALVAWLGGNAQAAGHPGRVVILAPDLALDVEQAADADLRARGFTVVPEVELYRAIERLGIQENTTVGRLALVRVLRLSATMTIKFPHPDTRLTAHGMLRDRRDRVVGVWRWSRRVDEVVAGTTPAPVAATSPVAGPAPAASPAAPARPALTAAAPGLATVAAPLPVAAATRPAGPPDVFAVAVGPRLLYRRLAYAGAPPGQLTDFDTQVPTLGLGLRVDWFPLPRAFRGLGVVGQLEQTRPIRSQTPVGSFVSPSRDLGIRGLDASAGIECHLGDAVTAAVGMDARMYRLNFRQSSSTRLTSGARDDYYSGWVRLGFRLGTSGT